MFFGPLAGELEDLPMSVADPSECLNGEREIRLIQENIRRHDLIAADYDNLHPEIFNATERRRLDRELHQATQYVRAKHVRSLDYGCGTGNVTRRLLLRGLEVCAADVSPEMLRIVRERHPAEVETGRLKIVQLPTKFPLPFPDRHFAFVAAYSVLHHVPDYFAAVRELVRVLDEGGVLYVDHEYNEQHWRRSVGTRVHRVLTMPSYSFSRGLVWLRALFGSKEPALPPPEERGVSDEGDIHIYADDHIDWSAIRSILAAEGLEEVVTEDYLLCRETSRFPIRHWLCRFLAQDMGIYVGYRPLSR